VYRRKQGIATAFAVAVIVIIVAVAGVGIYLAASGGNGTSSSSSSTVPASTSEPTLSSPSSTASTSQSVSTMSAQPTSGATTSYASTSSYTSTSCPYSTYASTMTGYLGGSLNFSGYFAAYSQMAVEFNGTYSGYSGHVSSDYRVIYASATTYKVNISETVSEGSAQVTLTNTAWVLKNGTAIAVDSLGQNHTGFGASTYFPTVMAGYAIGAAFGSPQILGAFTSLGFVHPTGTSTIMLGPTSVTATTYAANSIPLQVNQCGVTTDFTGFSLQAGAVAGVPGILLTGLNIAGSFSANGQSESANITYHITSLTRSS